MLALLVLHIVLHWQMIPGLFARLVDNSRQRSKIALVYIVLAAALVLFPLKISPEVKGRRCRPETSLWRTGRWQAGRSKVKNKSKSKKSLSHNICQVVVSDKEAHSYACEPGFPSEPRHFSRPRRSWPLDLLAENCSAPAFLLVLFIALRWTHSSGILRLFQRNTYTSFLSSLGAVYTLAFLAMQLVRTVLWWRYRPYPLPSGPLPKVTVLIPAYNEGAMVEKALYSVAAADYPKDLLEIICIDDGSRDDTWNHIQRARQRYRI